MVAPLQIANVFPHFEPLLEAQLPALFPSHVHHLFLVHLPQLPSQLGSIFLGFSPAPLDILEDVLRLEYLFLRLLQGTLIELQLLPQPGSVCLCRNSPIVGILEPYHSILDFALCRIGTVLLEGKL